MLIKSSVSFLREIKSLFGVKFKIEDYIDQEENDDDYEEEELEENEDYDEEKEEDSDVEDKKIDELINDSNANDHKVIFSCVGLGLRNVARKEI